MKPSVGRAPDMSRKVDDACTIEPHANRLLRHSSPLFAYTGITSMIARTFLLASVAIASSVGHAQQPIPQAQTDAIVAKFQTAYADTFDRRDAKAMAALLTEGATLQNEWGDVT